MGAIEKSIANVEYTIEEFMADIENDLIYSRKNHKLKKKRFIYKDV